jgi:DNA-binding transcriptional LysR family regulator
VRIQPNLELRDLRLVQAIYSERTTAAAAKVLGMTQSGVSHQLRNLEERLNGEDARFTSPSRA